MVCPCLDLKCVESLYDSFCTKSVNDKSLTDGTKSGYVFISYRYYGSSTKSGVAVPKGGFDNLDNNFNNTLITFSYTD